MPLSSQIQSRSWLAILGFAICWLLWANGNRVDRIDYISELAGGNEIAADPKSPTGYENGVRVLIVPEDNAESYQWIVQTQQMLADGTWRMRHVNYDNAPVGRDVFSASPFRWWLALVAWVQHMFSDGSFALAVEHAALVANPLFHLLFLVATAMYIAARFGPLAASASIVVLAGAFPLVGSFLPGQPEDRILVLACSLWSVLPLIGGTRSGSATTTQEPSRVRCVRRSFLVAGGVGGLGLWLGTSGQVPVLFGIAIGGIAVFWTERGRGEDKSRDGFRIPGAAWRWWSYGGAAVSATAYLIEYAPGHLWTLRLTDNHPAYALAWLGAGELLARATQWAEADRPKWNRRDILVIALAAGAIFLVPVIMIVMGSRAFLPLDPRLTNLPNSAIANNLFAWIARDGVQPATIATLLPALLLVPTVWLLVRSGKTSAQRPMLLLALGPAIVALGFALLQLRWWNHFELLLVGVIVAMAVAIKSDGKPRALPWLWLAAVVLVMLPGTKIVFSSATGSADRVVSPAEVESLVERDLAHWLARRVGPAGANVLAPPKLTTSLFFHGGLSGLGTPYRENEDGFAAAVRIAAATSADEGQALATSRELTHVVMPSWDPFLEEYARLGANEAESTMIAMLRRWLPPRWLRPVPYHLPDVEGFEDDYVALFEVVENQDNATALSRLAEYFIEMRQMEGAAGVGKALERSFPADLSALIARAQLAMATRDQGTFSTVVDAILPYLESGMSGSLAWDRRVSLAVVLAQGRHMIEARDQLELCLDEADEDLVRSLSTVSLYRVLALAKGFNAEFPDQRLEQLALELLPREMRAGL